MPEGVHEKVMDMAKRRGFLYPSYELYGGAAGFYDYGPLGATLKALLEQRFRQIYVVEEGAAEINTPAITVEDVLKASGHVGHFSDVIVTCKGCGSGYRADHFYPDEFERLAGALPADAGAAALATLIKETPSVAAALQVQTAVAKWPEKSRPKCPQCGSIDFDAPGSFNLMFKTHIGPGTTKVGYLRPETAQAMFVDFPHLYRYFREKLPFAACQIGRAYRNEISPRQGLIRLREFNQMEVEAFFDPDDVTHPGFDEVRGTVLRFVPNSTQETVEKTIGEAVDEGMVCNSALGYHLVLVQRLLTGAGVDINRLHFRQHLKDEMAHYANDCWDAEYLSDRFGWVECVGVADRSTYDVSQHEKHSGKPLKALRRYAEPKKVQRTKVTAVGAKLGPLFKKDAPKVIQALAALGDDEASKAGSSDHVMVQVDGAAIRVPADAYNVETVTETVAGEHFTPHVVEPSYGVDRILYALLEHNYSESQKEGETYTRLTLPAAMAPFSVGVFPLMARDELDATAHGVARILQGASLRVHYDDGGSIGRRYARADEIGTPLCVTVDYDTLKDRTVTVRERDTTNQERVAIAALVNHLRARLEHAESPGMEAPPSA